MLDSLSAISFEYPYVFLVLLLFLICDKFCKAKVQSYFIPHLDFFNASKKVSSSFDTFLKYMIVLAATIALASPVKELNVINSKNDGIDIILSLDTSGSMRQRGFNPQNIEQTRWSVVSSIVKDFITKRENDNIGIVVFGTSVMTASALSYDKKAQAKIIDGLDIAIVGEKTALIDSIASSVNILKERETKSKVIIALTDGDDTASNIPLSVVLKLIKKYEIKLYTIAIGSASNYVLEQMSQISGGKSFSARSKSDLKSIYETIDKLEKSKLEQNKIVLKEYYYFYPLYVAFFALLLFIYLRNKKEI